MTRRDAAMRRCALRTMGKTAGTIYAVAGATVTARGLFGAAMHTVCRVGSDGLLGEVIRIEGDSATLQVYEDTTGLRAGEPVVSEGRPLTALLGPGLISGIFDGIQRPLQAMRDSGAADFIARGFKMAAVDLERAWDFEPLKKAGDPVSGGEAIGLVAEPGRIMHRVLAPPGTSGTVREIKKGMVSAMEPVCLLGDGGRVMLHHEWPVRRPRPHGGRVGEAARPFATGQRVFDTLFPLAEGGCAVVPGGFGTGKTIVEQTIAKFSRSDVVVYVGCGERGNEMTELLSDFPVLVDPETGRALSERTVIVVNTSNMPVAAREASIFTGVTIAEYYRDMGYSVALLADSISRWAEALREISSRLEEMPGEEGFPPYLAALLGSFYERAGAVRCLGGGRGAVTIVSAVSPPGGDFSEPVTQASLRFAGALWALDPDLANRRHFPAVNWRNSFSLYAADLAKWFSREVSPEFLVLRDRLIALLQREAELREIVQITGAEALQEPDRLTLEAAGMAREAFLRQSVFNEADAFNSHEKQHWMLKAVFAWLDSGAAALKSGAPLDWILSGPARSRILEMQGLQSAGFAGAATAVIREMESGMAAERGAAE